MTTAERLIAAGANIDLGLLQVNSRNLRPLGLSVADAFDACRNLDAGARVLTSAYLAATPTAATPQAALETALSRYNTGSPVRGYANGYVARVHRAAAQVVPALAAVDAPAAPPADSDRTSAVRLQAAPAAPESKPTGVNVFARPSATLVDWTRPIAPAPAGPAAIPTPSPQGEPS